MTEKFLIGKTIKEIRNDKLSEIEIEFTDGTKVEFKGESARGYEYITTKINGKLRDILWKPRKK